VTVDVTKVNCDQFVHHKISEPRLIAAWLSGDAPVHRAIEHLGVITSRPVLGGLHHNIAESDFRYTQAGVITSN
jgi:hypothetical protein